MNTIDTKEFYFFKVNCESLCILDTILRAEDIVNKNAMLPFDNLYELLKQIDNMSESSSTFKDKQILKERLKFLEHKGYLVVDEKFGCRATPQLKKEYPVFKEAFLEAHKILYKLN
jgi:hypothetical protein